jgi:hypothetical protein
MEALITLCVLISTATFVSTSFVLYKVLQRETGITVQEIVTQKIIKPKEKEESDEYTPQDMEDTIPIENFTPDFNNKRKPFRVVVKDEEGEDNATQVN